MATIRDRGSEQLELATAFSSLGTRGFLSLFCTFRRLLRMLVRPLFVIRLRHPFIISSPLDARGLLGFFFAFCRLLGMLRAFFAHAAPFLPASRANGLAFSS